MVMQASGAITMAQVQAEFGGTNPISLNEYYGAAPGIPTSDLLAFLTSIARVLTTRRA